MDREKHLFVFSASWCGPCRMMKAYVWSDPDVQKNLNHFHSVNFIDIDDPKNRDVTVAYRVNAVPMIYIVDDKGKPLKVGSTMDVNQTVEFLNYE
jgi:thiol:disulfide interchange protein